MREIEFRGKIKGTNDFVCGNLIYGTDGRCFISTINKNPIYKNGDFWYIDTPCYEVDRNTIGQYAGLRDKKGTKIFEGDKLKDERCHGDFSDDTITVVFFEGKFCYPNYGTLSDLSDCVEYSEIIGNIHENPELLKNPLN